MSQYRDYDEKEDLDFISGGDIVAWVITIILIALGIGGWFGVNFLWETLFC